MINLDAKKTAIIDLLKEVDKLANSFSFNISNNFDKLGLNEKTILDLPFTKSIKTYTIKLVRFYSSRFWDSREYEDFKSLLKVVGGFFTEAAKIDKNNRSGAEYSTKIFVIYKSLINPAKLKETYRNAGRKRKIDLDKTTQKIANRKAKREVKGIKTWDNASYFERQFFRTFGKWPKDEEELRKWIG